MSKESPQSDDQVKGQKINNVLWFCNKGFSMSFGERVV